MIKLHSYNEVNENRINTLADSARVGQIGLQPSPGHFPSFKRGCMVADIDDVGADRPMSSGETPLVRFCWVRMDLEDNS